MSVIQFVLAHQVVFASLLVAVIDCAIALNGKLASNSIIQVVLPFLQKEAAPKA